MNTYRPDLSPPRLPDGDDIDARVRRDLGGDPRPAGGPGDPQRRWLRL
ncbi:MAG: hypothetical protein WCP30_07290 [Mycobacteriaceae bacterium]